MNNIDNDFKKTRILKKNLEKEFSSENIPLIAEFLTSEGIYEFTDEHKKITAFLKEHTNDFSYDNYYYMVALANETWVSLEAKKQLYYTYTSKKPNMGFFTINEDLINQYINILKDNKFNESDISSIMADIIELVPIAKDPNSLKDTIAELQIFEINQEDINCFIVINATYLFNDYSQNLSKLYDELIQKYENKAFDKLKENPSLIRTWSTKKAHIC